MKPRTQLQFDVFACSKQLYKRDRDIIDFARKECLDLIGYATKTRVLCMECGGKFSTELVSRKRAVCPHCKTKLKIEVSKKRTNKQEIDIAYAEVYGEYQLIRNFEIIADYREAKEASFWCREVLQHWILPDGRREVIARCYNTNCTGWYGDLEIRQKEVGSYYRNRVNDVFPYKFHPDSTFQAQYRKYGIDHNLQGLSFLEAMKIVPDYPKAETLLKSKYYNLLSYYRSSARYKIQEYWPSIKICIRNKYKIKDADIYFDYLDLLRYFRKDLHNAHFVCPKNLKKEHDRLSVKKRKIQEIQKVQEKRKKALEDEAKFKTLKARFFGLAFSDNEIDVKVLESVKEHMEEGDALKHCVFTNEYYLRADSLILSATIKGKRIETVEISLEKMEVVQSRGLQNKNTEYHDRIISLVNKNMRLVKQRLKPTKREVKRSRKIGIAV